ncbi:MAG TPA: PKD domain-containing protein, partial [Chitinophagaceae bacterium]|nr:PKD domain-containing protein [Chitinophagaceae bacterium]
NNYIDPAVVEIKGGNGANMTASGFQKVGPGGGGGGGKTWLINPSLPAPVTVTVSGGQNGVCTAYANDPWGATPGQLGSTLFNLIIPVDNTPFKSNIDSVRIKDSATSCNSFDFKGFGYTNTNPVNSWQWFFGDGGNANTQNTSHTYATNGTFTVKLIVTDINGCKDSITKNVITNCLNSIGSIINSYTPVLALNPCDNKITVEDGTPFNTGDTVLMIQMKGAVIDSTNTAAFGTITDYKNAGNYEFNYVKSKTGNIIELKNKIIRQYDIPNGKVQLIRVPYYQNASVTSTLTCLPWDGSKGGVLVLNVQDTINLGANIDVGGKGFRGGNSPNTGSTTLYCSNNNYFYAAGNLAAAAKGESISVISNPIAWGKGSPSNGGGGGSGHNSGGGGGANGSTGGLGGYQLLPCTGSAFDNRGIGGHALTYNNALNRIYMGGGGGSGHVDNAGGSNMEGGNGGGIIIIRSKVITPNGFKISSNGDNARQCSFSNFSDCHDGSGGGGGGGTILIQNNNYLATTQIDAKGGKGGDLIIYNAPAGADKIGPGGGGSGGVIWFNSASNPANTSSGLNFGANGVIIPNANDPWGATPGQSGISLFNLNIPVASVLFKPNIDSVRIKDSITSCSSFDFKGFGYTNSNPVANWQWYFGDGGMAATQNTSHTYATVGTFTVKLVVTDINGCKDSITRNVNTSFLTMDAGPADTICTSNSTTLQSSASGATQYAWVPAIYLNDPTILNPVATPPVSTTFYLTATNAAGCSQTDSVRIEVRAANGFSVSPPVDICKNTSVQLNASGGDVYSWSPAGSLNNAAIPNPIASPANTTPYTVNITDTLCGFSTNLTTTVTILPLPNVRASKTNDIDCSTPQSLLSASGASMYSWLPSATLNNSNISNPIASPTVTTQYNVTGTDLSGCINYDSIIVKVSAANTGGYLMPTGFTPNNDGKNDCYGIKYWGTITKLEFSIYNRWGERIFYTTNPNVCWDGTISGVKQDPAVFIYMIKARTTCQPGVFRKGTFVLIR